VVESGDGEGERERQEKGGEGGVVTPEGEPQSSRRKPREDEEEARSPHVGYSRQDLEEADRMREETP
jgi:hypothetical protein